MGVKIVNPCILCGKERIVTETHVEKVELSNVTYVTTTCPDPECQKKVDDMLSKEKAKRQDVRVQFEKREQERLQRRNA